MTAQRETSEPTDNLAQSASRGVAITLTAQAAKIAVQLLSVVVLARLLDPSDFGIIAMVLAIVGAAEIFRDFGLSTAAVQAPALTSGQRDNLFWVNLGFGMLCMIAIAAAAPLAGWLYGNSDLVGPMLILSVSFVLNGASAQYVAGLNRSLRFRALSYSMVASQALGAAVAIVMAYTGAGYWALVGQQLAMTGAMLILSVALSRWFPRWPDRRASIRPLMRFGLATVGSKCLSYAAKNVDVAALGFVTTATSVGFYSRAQQLVLVPIDQINTPLTRVALPILSRVSADRDLFQRYAEKSQLVACYITSTGLFVLAGLASPIIEIVLGPRWGAVTPLFMILAIGGAFRSMAQVTYWGYLAKGLVGAQLRLTAVTQTIIVLFILAGLNWGTVGVAVGSSVGHLLFWLIGLWHIRRVGDVRTGPLFLRSLMAMLVLGAPAGLMAYFASVMADQPLEQLGLGGAAATVTLLMIGASVRPIRDDIAIIVRFGLEGIRR